MGSRELAVRFCVSDGAMRSSTWKCFSGRGQSKNDFYLSCREWQGVFKVSFHESGDWRLAYEPHFWTEAREKDQSLPKGRLLDQWQKPDEVFPGGILAFRIFFDHGTLTDILGEEAKKLVLIPPPTADHVVGVFIFLTSPELENLPQMTAQGMTVIGRFSLPDGRRVWLSYISIEGDFGQSPVSSAGTFIESDRISAEEGHVRSFFVGQDSVGLRLVVERSINAETFEKVRQIWPSKPTSDSERNRNDHDSF